MNSEEFVHDPPLNRDYTTTGTYCWHIQISCSAFKACVLAPISKSIKEMCIDLFAEENHMIWEGQEGGYIETMVKGREMHFHKFCIFTQSSVCISRGYNLPSSKIKSIRVETRIRMSSPNQETYWRKELISFPENTKCLSINSSSNFWIKLGVDVVAGEWKFQQLPELLVSENFLINGVLTNISCRKRRSQFSVAFWGASADEGRNDIRISAFNSGV